MSEWIESHVTLPRNKKFRRLARALGTTIPETLGLLHALWYYTLEQAPSGLLEGHTAEDIAEGCYYAGDPATLLDAFVSTGWVDRTPDGLAIHDWADYNRQHRERQKAAERQAEKRLRDRESGEGHGDVTVTSRPKERSDRQKETKDRERARAEALESENWTGLWITQLQEAGQPRPSKGQIDIFGAKLKTIASIDPAIMQDTISRMVERNKGPTLLPNIYGDCEQQAEREIFEMQVGGNRRVR